jgi:hypothetical protein
MKRANAPSDAAGHRRALVKLLQECSYRHERHRVFSDFVEMAALATANAVDWVQRDRREAQYMATISRYSAAEAQLFPRMLAHLVEALSHDAHDALGQVFGELELGNAARGQFFTPFEICRLMAEVTIDEGEIRRRIDEQGYVTLQEPSCGSGAQVMAFALALQARGFDYQRHLHVTAIDVDPRAAHMAYLQLSLLHVPAQVIVGNTLTLECRDVFYTPAHIFGGWTRRLRTPRAIEAAVAPVPQVPGQLPLFSAEAA